jgi:hypothetical protein
MIHDVDPTGRHVASLCVNFDFAAFGNASDLRELPVANGDIGENPRIACTVEDTTVPNHDVERRVLRAKRRCCKANCAERGCQLHGNRTSAPSSGTSPLRFTDGSRMHAVLMVRQCPTISNAL